MSYRNRDYGKRLDSSAVKQVLTFLFGKKEDSKFLDTSTDISSKEFFKTLTYYGILSEEYGCEAAKSIGDLLKRLSISTDRMGRLEGVTVLKQEMPKEEILFRGCLLYTSPSPRDRQRSRMPSSA